LQYHLYAYDDAARTQLDGSIIFSWSVDGSQSLSAIPAANRSGDYYMRLTVSDLTGRTSQQDFALHVTPVADVPLLTVPPTIAATLDSGAFALNFSADLQDTDGSEALAIAISGLPAELSLNHG